MAKPYWKPRAVAGEVFPDSSGTKFVITFRFVAETEEGQYTRDMTYGNRVETGNETLIEDALADFESELAGDGYELRTP